MRYDDFREQLEIALQNAGLLGQCLDSPVETIELESTQRRWRIYVPASSRGTEPFYVSAKIAFNWDPFNAARSFTCEEDLLEELLGKAKESSKTEPRYVRVDLELYASLPYGSTCVIPHARAFGSWADAIHRKLDRVFRENIRRQGDPGAVQGGLEELNIESRCDSSGRLSMAGVSVAGFRIIRIPRVWDNPGRQEKEKSAADELSRVSEVYKFSLDAWRVAIAELTREIRYTPPPEGAAQAGPPAEDLEMDDETNGPETIH